jgi:hypothetical protein
LYAPGPTALLTEVPGPPWKRCDEPKRVWGLRGRTVANAASTWYAAPGVSAPGTRADTSASRGAFGNTVRPARGFSAVASGLQSTRAIILLR